MKIDIKPSASKLVAKFDNHLKNILLEDIKAFKAKHQFLINNNQQAQQSNLSAA